MLYIIGNGFDLHHGMKSRYCDFKDFLEDKDSELIDKLEEYFGSDALWSDFEETLAYLDTSQIIDECLNYLEPYDAEDWSDAYHHDYQYEVQRRIDMITKDLKKYFTEWILQLELPADANHKKIQLKNSSKFINFNYTDTLEQLYRVPFENIIYIHNKAENNDSTLILGHSRNPKVNKSLYELDNDEDTDVRVTEGNKILDEYFEETYKSTDKIINLNKPFFKSLKNLKEIYVLGHSLSKVDIPYIEEIIRNIDKTKTKWIISIHSRKELMHHKDVMIQLGIEPRLFEFDMIKNFEKRQLTLFPKETF